MTIFYFTSTGNSLAVAKRIGGNLISIPQVISSKKKEYQDDAIGIIFPTYGWAAPKMVRRFLNKVHLKADYIFAIATYGGVPGAAVHGLRKLAAKRGLHFDYTNHLLMVDNYLPIFDMEREAGRLPKKKTEEHIAQIMKDLSAHRHYHVKHSFLSQIGTSFVEKHQKRLMNSKQAQSFIVNNKCTQCGI